MAARFFQTPATFNLTPRGLLRHLTPQKLLATVFLAGGTWCLVAPGSMLRVCFRPDVVVTASTVFVTQCFGSQAVLCGTLLATTKMTRRSFLTFAVATLPFFVFDVWYSLVNPVMTVVGGLADGVGNVIIVSSCLWGAWRETKEENDMKEIKDQ